MSTSTPSDGKKPPQASTVIAWFLLATEELNDRIAVLLGGRAAEDVAFGRVGTGAGEDLQKATQLARRITDPRDREAR